MLGRFILGLLAIQIGLFFHSTALAAVPNPPAMCGSDFGFGCEQVGAGEDLESLEARFIGPGGRDSNDGKTHATRWETTKPADRLPTGTDVYLMAAFDQGPRAWRIDWDGTESDPVTVGCYYLDSVNGSTVTSCSEGSRKNQLEKPIIRGTYTTSCRSVNPSTCQIDSAGAVPSSRWVGLLDIGASHVVVQDLEVHDAAGPGIKTSGEYLRSNVTIQRVRIRQTFGAAVWFNKPKGDVVLRDSDVDYAVLQRVDGRSKNWPSAISVDADGRAVNALFENNTLTNSGGEGITVLRASHAVIRGNTVANVRRPLVYLDNASDVVVEHNMLLGNGYMNGVDESFGVAIGIAVEPYGSRTFDSVRNVFRNNLVANTKGGIHLSIFQGSDYNCDPCIDPAAMGYQIGLRAYGNTILQNKSNFISGGDTLKVNNNVDFIEIANNIFVGTDECRLPSLPADALSITNNVFESVPSDPDCRGVDYVVGNPGIVLDYQSVSAANIPTSDNFSFDSASIASGAGVARPDFILDINSFPQFADFSSRLCKSALSDWTKGLTFDYRCRIHSETPDAGALHSRLN